MDDVKTQLEGMAVTASGSSKIVVTDAQCQMGMPLSSLDYPQPTCVPVATEISDYGATVSELLPFETVDYSFTTAYQKFGSISAVCAKNGSFFKIFVAFSPPPPRPRRSRTSAGRCATSARTAAV
ncbi:MAG TPA: hypothetical protein EYP98_17450 [Planctomycetes bacterium]|nr:hypothetical protein [Planctomycetota bacterium]